MEYEIWDKNYNLWLWYSAFFLGLFLFLFGIIYFYIKRKEKHTIQKSAIIELLACWILHIPYEFSLGFTGDGLFIQFLKSELVALLKALTKYLGEGYEDLYYYDRPIFSALYCSLVACVNISMLLFAAGFIVKLISGPIQNERLFRNRKKYLYLFTEFNEKSKAIANSIKDKDNCNVVFLSENDDDIELQMNEVDSLGALIINENIYSFLKKYITFAKGIEVFVFNEFEKNNLIQLDDICNAVNESKIPIKIYVELNKTPWDLYDNVSHKINNKNVILNFVRSEENFVYNCLLENSIFENFIQITEKHKEIKIIIIGYNNRNIEMLKAVLHLSQMPGFYPIITFIDDGNNYDKLNALMPEIFNAQFSDFAKVEDGFGCAMPYYIIENHCDKEGVALYDIKYISQMRYDSYLFKDYIRDSFFDFTFAFVNLDNDLYSLDVALNLNSICIQNDRKGDYRILLNIYNSDLWEYWSKGLLDGIREVGSIESVYNYDFITMSAIEQASKSMHDIRHEKDGIEWSDYCNDEYDRHSVYARTLSLKYKVQFIKDSGGDFSVTTDIYPWKVYEHMRWLMYTRTLGYTYPSLVLLKELSRLEDDIISCRKELKAETDIEQKKKIRNDLDDLIKQRSLLRKRSKCHENLIPFESLKDDVKEYDGLKLVENRNVVVLEKL